MNTYRNTLRKLQTAIRSTLRSTSAPRASFERMEDRRLMSATAVKAVDSGGPDFDMVESNGHVIVLTSSASGAGKNQIWRTDGGTDTSKVLVNANASGETINSFDELVAANDGTVYFTANATTGGRQVFKLNVEDGGYTQVTSQAGAYFQHLTLVGTKLYMVEGNSDKVVTLTSKGKINEIGTGSVTAMFAAKDSIFWVLGADGGLWTDSGDGAGKKLTGSLTFGASKVFGTNDYIYFLGGDGNNTSLYRTDGTTTTPTKIADDFFIYSNQIAEFDGGVYLSGSFYGGAGVGSQVYKITTSTGAIAPVTTLAQTNGGAAPAGISAIGSNVYFTANDGEFITSAGTYDRELWRYNATSGTTTKVTTDETLYPIETSGGVLGSYYFVAAPTKADSRFGSRRLYRTTPSNDQVEEIAGLPSYTNSNSETKEDVSLVFAAGKGLFFSARNNDGTGGDYDTYFVPTPYTYIDPVTKDLIVTATDSNDTMTLTVDDGDFVFNLNGVEERVEIGTFTGVKVYMKLGDDRFTADASVTMDLYVSGDSGNDTVIGGSGNDNLLGGGGKNKVYGMAGNDRLRGGNGSDMLDGGDGNDRLYGWAGSDNLLGGNGVDYLYGDDITGLQGNDILNGGSGNDRLYGRGGNDQLVGGKQNDTMYGHEGDDTLTGNDGNDYLDGGTGADKLYGGAGTDTFEDAADGAFDFIDGGDDSDTLLGKDDDDEVALVEVVN